MTLHTENRLADPDGLYQRLIELHRDLSDEQSHALNARLILLLANHIGEAAVLDEALAAAVGANPEHEDPEQHSGVES